MWYMRCYGVGLAVVFLFSLVGGCDVVWRPDTSKQGRCRAQEHPELQRNPPFTPSRQHLWGCLRIEKEDGELLSLPQLVKFTSDGKIAAQGEPIAPSSAPPQADQFTETPSFGLSRNEVGALIRFRLLIPNESRQSASSLALAQLCQRDATRADYRCEQAGGLCWFALSFERDPQAERRTSCALSVGQSSSEPVPQEVPAEPVGERKGEVFADAVIDRDRESSSDAFRREQAADRIGDAHTDAEPDRSMPEPPRERRADAPDRPETVLDQPPRAVNWASLPRGTGENDGFAIVADGRGTIIVAGVFRDSCSFGTTTLTTTNAAGDMFIAGIDAANGRWKWAINTSGTDQTRPYDLAVDTRRNALYVVGFYKKKLDFLIPQGTRLAHSKSQSEQGFLARFDLVKKEWVWVRAFTSTNSAVVNSVAVSGTGSVLLGGWLRENIYFANGSPSRGKGISDGWLAEYTTLGVEKWAIVIGGNGVDRVEDIVGDAFGNAYVIGSFSSTFVLGNITLVTNTNSVFVARFDNKGVPFWAKSIAPTSGASATGRRIALNKAGVLLISGTFVNSVAVGGNRITSKGFADVFVARLDPLTKPAWRWIKSAGSRGDETLNGLTFGPRGNHGYATGTYSDTVSFQNTPSVVLLNDLFDAFVVKIDLNGNWVSALRGTGNAFERGTAITTDPFSGGIFSTGYVTSKNAFFGQARVNHPSPPNNSAYVWRVQ